MEAYFEFAITCNEDIKELLIAELAELEYEGFIETDEGFSAYIPQSLHNALTYNDLLLKYGINPNDVPHSVIEPQNWNAQWEASYEPIIVADKILVRAPFHDLQMNYEHTITIQPKNTFGAFRAFKRELIERVGYQCHVVFNQSVQIGGKQYDEGCMYSLPKHLAEYYKEKNCCIIEYTYFNLWGNDKNHGLDFSSESKLIESGVKAHIVKFDDPQIIDFKSEQNIWSFKNYWTMSTDADTDKVLRMLSEAEREKVLHFANC
jgi:hypothetical protein